MLAGDLRFSKLSLEDSGMYQCVAENKHGTVYASAELAVQGRGPREAGQPRGRGGQRGALVMTCSTSKHTNTPRQFSLFFQQLLSRTQGFQKGGETLGCELPADRALGCPMSGSHKVNVCCSEERWQK